MPVLIDSNVILDVFTRDSQWFDWSSKTLTYYAERELLYINPIIYSEISIGFKRIEELELALPGDYILRENLPYEAAFLAGKCFLKYRKSGGVKNAPLPDFYIGAHAAVRGWSILTRDNGRFNTYFPSLHVITPEKP
ncbi:type II toxin-antitoxin system VapC family toxin [Nitrosomonas sp.]|uniref:type II toxin-antitoxin system VapC family toxin n=1 Tax=Nitrosomonas sp. TaxID=42353 RepID=UPI001D500D8D|nr:type II toxin-antitoxin system VapC family toxin [Nitrosomonas sp.]MCB1948447.1 type II toxin-antitoxin system VapC family toxin [Nitrosomonas sp.]